MTAQLLSTVLMVSKVVARIRKNKLIPISSTGTTVALAAFLGLALSASTASADLVEYRVEGTFDTGNLAGRHYLEIFTFDDSSRPPVLGTVPWTTPLLSYDLDVEGLSYHWTLADWPLEHTFSQFIGTNGFVNSLAYLATPGPPGDPPGDPPAESIFFDDGAPNSRSQNVKWYDWPRWGTLQTDSTDSDPIVTVAIVPEPSSVLLVGTGFLGLLGYGWWRRKSSA